MCIELTACSQGFTLICIPVCIHTSSNTHIWTCAHTQGCHLKSYSWPSLQFQFKQCSHRLQMTEYWFIHWALPVRAHTGRPWTSLCPAHFWNTHLLAHNFSHCTLSHEDRAAIFFFALFSFSQSTINTTTFLTALISSGLTSIESSDSGSDQIPNQAICLL